MSTFKAIAALFEPSPRGERRAVAVGELIVRTAAVSEGEWRNCFAIKRSGARLFGAGFRTGNLGRKRQRGDLVARGVQVAQQKMAQN